MAVRRIVANIAADQVGAAAAFYRDVLGLGIVMDLGWIVTFQAPGQAPGNAPPQLSVAREGGSGQPVPDLTVEVDDLDAVEARARAAGFPPAYGPVTEPWGVRRFFLLDPFGRLVNVMAHAAAPPGP